MSITLTFCRHWNMKKFQASGRSVITLSSSYSKGCRHSDLSLWFHIYFLISFINFHGHKMIKNVMYFEEKLRIVWCPQNIWKLLIFNFIFLPEKVRKSVTYSDWLSWHDFRISPLKSSEVSVNFQHRMSSGKILIEISRDTPFCISWRSSLESACATGQLKNWLHIYVI